MIVFFSLCYDAVYSFIVSSVICSNVDSGSVFVLMTQQNSWKIEKEKNFAIYF